MSALSAKDAPTSTRGGQSCNFRLAGGAASGQPGKSSVAAIGALSLAFGAIGGWAGTAEAAIIVTDVNTSFREAPVNILFGGTAQFTLSRMIDPNFGPKNYITTLGSNLYAQQSLAGKIISDQPDPIPGNVSLKFVAAPTPTDLLSVPRTVEFFVPLELVSGANRNFGYAHLGTANDGATLLSYAFETTSGKALIAGDRGAPVPVPEPSTLGLLAFGAASVLVARRRRRRTATA